MMKERPVRLAANERRVRLLTSYVTREMLNRECGIKGFADRLLAGEELVVERSSVTFDGDDGFRLSFADSTYAMGGFGDMTLPCHWVEPVVPTVMPDTRDYLEAVTG
jgi:hypothetical protein